MTRSVKRLWNRSTTGVENAQLPAAVLAAVRRHAETVGADDPSMKVTRACVTTSESLERKRRLRRPTPPVDVYMLLAEPLLVVVADQQGRMVASFLRLDEIELTEFKSPLVDDVGLEVFGTAVGATERGMRFLPLDHGSAGAAFRTALLDRVRSGSA
jgi:hypothetical protein